MLFFELFNFRAKFFKNLKFQKSITLLNQQLFDIDINVLESRLAVSNEYIRNALHIFYFPLKNQQLQMLFKKFIKIKTTDLT